MTNVLIGVLHRFRRGKVGVMCDIQRMFHMFKVHEYDRIYLRFLWFRDTTMLQIAEYCMTSHLFGATFSPACAAHGLRTIATEQHDSNDVHSMKAAQFITNDSYIDDGLRSFDSVVKTVAMVKEAFEICSKENFRLHKLLSNDERVLSAIPNSECANAIKDLDLQSNSAILPVERALGVHWCLQSDTFQFKTNLKERALTRRGVLLMTASVLWSAGVSVTNDSGRQENVSPNVQRQSYLRRSIWTKTWAGMESLETWVRSA